MTKKDAENPCNHAEMQLGFPKNLETYRFWKSGNHSNFQSTNQKSWRKHETKNNS
jgi:hypothetical protein